MGPLTLSFLGRHIHPTFPTYHAHSLDFLAVRKIPLKQRPYLMDNAADIDLEEVRQTSSEDRTSDPWRSIDPAVHKILTLIRKKVLSDRALHDQVSPLTDIIIVMSGMRSD